MPICLLDSFDMRLVYGWINRYDQREEGVGKNDVLLPDLFSFTSASSLISRKRKFHISPIIGLLMVRKNTFGELIFKEN